MSICIYQMMHVGTHDGVDGGVGDDMFGLGVGVSVLGR